MDNYIRLRFKDTNESSTCFDGLEKVNFFYSFLFSKKYFASIFLFFYPEFIAVKLWVLPFVFIPLVFPPDKLLGLCFCFPNPQNLSICSDSTAYTKEKYIFIYVDVFDIFRAKNARAQRRRLSEANFLPSKTN